MKYFKNGAGVVFAFNDDGSQDGIIGPELVAMTVQEIEDHLNKPEYQPTTAEQLAATDADMARITEDLLDTLIGLGVLTMADMSQPAQDKINTRKALRAQL